LLLGAMNVIEKKLGLIGDLQPKMHGSNLNDFTPH
jgi:hypothetical protein